MQCGGYCDQELRPLFMVYFAATPIIDINIFFLTIVDRNTVFYGSRGTLYLYGNRLFVAFPSIREKFS